MCFSVQKGSSQEKKQVPLAEIIHAISSSSGYIFSYADEEVVDITVNLPTALTSADEIINFLQANTPLEFKYLNAKEVVIVPKKLSFSICGYVVDYETGEPIENVVVETINGAIVTDGKGYFKTKRLTPNSFISFNHMGYKSIKHPANYSEEGHCETIALISKVEQLTEIVIRNYFARSIQKNVNGSYEISYDAFELLPGLIEPDVLQTIQALPGIQSVDESVSNMNIRGGANAEILLQWDGIKMYQSGHFFGLISAFNPHITDTARLIKNGSDAHLNDGVSGTIQMETSSKIESEFKAGVGLNMINADGFVVVPIGSKSSLEVGGRKSINNFWKTPAYKQYFDKAFQNTEISSEDDLVITSDDEFSFYDVNVTWNYQLSQKDFIKVSGLHFENNLTYLENASIGDELESKESSAAQRNSALSIFYDRNWSDKFSSNVQVYASLYNLYSNNQDILNEQRLIQENEVEENALRINTAYRRDDKFTWLNSYDYSETGITNIQDVDNPLYYRRVKEVIRTHGLSSAVKYQSPNKRTNIYGGLRLNYIEKFATAFVEPRLQVDHQINDALSVELLGEFKNQTTTQVIEFQEDFLGVENRRWILSDNDTIPIVKSKQLSLGVRFNDKGWLLSAEPYFKKVSGITSQSQGFQNQFQYIKSVGDYNAYGIDLLVNKRYHQFNGWLSYSYSKSTYNFEEFSPNEFPTNFDIPHSVSSGLNYEYKKLTVATGITWRSGKPYTVPLSEDSVLSNNVQFGEPNSKRLDPYMRWDASAQYQLKLDDRTNGIIGVSVWNLLNQEHIINTYFRSTDGTTIEQVNQYSLGLTPNVSFRVNF